VKRSLTVAVAVLGVACIAVPFALRARQKGELADHALARKLPAATEATLGAARRTSVSDAMSLQAAGLALVVDVRIERSFRAGHIPGALNVPVDQIDARGPEILRAAAGRPIVTYCACLHEHTSAAAAQALTAAGAREVSALLGGYPSWVAHGGRVEK
jgi:rhodanese-related sulfurtransferase